MFTILRASSHEPVARRAICAALLLFFPAMSVALGALEIENVQLGFNDGYKLGTWVPVSVTVRSHAAGRVFDGAVAVSVQNFSTDTPLERYTAPLQLVGAESQRKTFSVYCPKNATQLRVQIVPAPSTPIAPADTLTQDLLLPTPFSRKDCFVLVLAPSGDRLKRFMDKNVLSVPGDPQVGVRYLPNSLALPSSWIGYNAVDTLVIRGVRLTARQVRTAQQTALLDWLHRGGTLIVSGGSSFNDLKGSFIEPLLPMELRGVQRAESLPAAVREPLGFQPDSDGKTPFERIDAVLKPDSEAVISTEDQIYVAKRRVGDGQILCFAFDYNAPPFSEQPVAERFWDGILSAHGKSPRHFYEQYALTLQHEAKTYQHFLSEMPAQVPVIKRLAVVLPIYLIAFGGFLFFFGRSRQRSRIYWIGGAVLVLVSVGALVSARHVLPNAFTGARFSILSVYPEGQRAHLLRYVSLRTTASTETSIGFAKDTFLRRLDTGRRVETIGTSVQGAAPQLNTAPMDPWSPMAFVSERLFALEPGDLPQTLEQAWRVSGEEMTYLGDVPLGGTITLPPAQIRRAVTPKLPFDDALTGGRETFARILQRDYVLRYLATEADLKTDPYFIGWTSQKVADMQIDANVDTNDETLVIFRPGTGPPLENRTARGGRAEARKRR